MRIIAGTKKGMKLFSPKGDASRPIIDRVKESLFSVMYKYDLPAGAFVADLFCGVGSLGIEALSRGAEFVTFVEKDRRTAAILERNLQKAGFIKESKVITANAWKIGAPAVEGRKYDLVFVDPPYADTADVSADSALAGLLLVLENQVAVGGIVIVRTNKDAELLDKYGGFDLIERRIWGTMAVGFLSLRKR
jgi:16S rRNA (guanine(966)-N(2))-methyltransferase RsmD